MNNTILSILLQMAQPHKQSGGYSGLIMILLIVLVIVGIVLIAKKQTSKNISNNKNYPQPPMSNYTENTVLTTTMAFCPECGTKINDMRFCQNCGYDISTYKTKQQSPKEENPNTADKNAQYTITSNLFELKKLLDSGVITQEDYDKKKHEYLEKM
jgi:ribosomal protein L32